MVKEAKCPRPIDRWTAIKLQRLSEYLKGYVRAATSALQRSYLDAFAGCGQCVMKDTGRVIDGSALRALKVSPAFTEAFFVEKDPETATHLRTNVAAYTGAQVFEGDCNDVIPREVLPKMSRLSASFAFLDPTGLQLHWDTIRALALHRDVSRTRRKMELLILYPYDMVIDAKLFNDSMRPTLTRFYGGDAWCAELQESQRLGERRPQRRDRFVNFYCRKLECELGYQHVEPLSPLYAGQRPLYHVIFAGDHPTGLKIMKKVWKPSKFKPLEDELGGQQGTLL